MENLRYGPHWPAGGIPDGQPFVRICVANAQCYGYLGDELVNASFLLFGEVVPLLDTDSGLYKVRVFNKYDEYIDPSRTSRELIEPTHFISVPYARVVKDVDVKSERETKRTRSEYLRFTSPVRVLETRDRGTGRHVLVEGAGWIPESAVRPIGDYFTDYVEVIKSLRGAVYGHGERGGLSGDCSSVIQSACHACGIPCPRIAGDIAKELGVSVPLTALNGSLRRGDLICWVGHVGVMLDTETILHWNEYAMRDLEEPLRDLLARRRMSEPPGKQEITTIRRLPDYNF